MNQAVFTPLGMTRADYVVREQDTDGNVAEYFAADGNTKAYPYYTSLAATGLHTTTSDMYRFVASQWDSDEASARILLPQTQQLMRQTHASMFGLAIWGADPMLFADNNAGGFIIGHGGQSPSLNTTARLNPDTGNGIVIFETGNVSLASDIATQWTLWETGKPYMYILRNALPVMFKRILIGYVIILLLAFIAGWQLRRQWRSLRRHVL
jgi:CubicO group peptidase (beta-lactamase class C family)